MCETFVKIVHCCLNIPQIWLAMFFQRFKLNISWISHQQAKAEHWDLPNDAIFQSKDVASGLESAICKFKTLNYERHCCFCKRNHELQAYRCMYRYLYKVLAGKRFFLLYLVPEYTWTQWEPLFRKLSCQNISLSIRIRKWQIDFWILWGILKKSCKFLYVILTKKQV
jgi:hypothetical protein